MPSGDSRGAGQEVRAADDRPDRRLVVGGRAVERDGGDVARDRAVVGVPFAHAPHLADARQLQFAVAPGAGVGGSGVSGAGLGRPARRGGRAAGR